MYLEREEAFDYLRGIMPGHKGLGLLAQLRFEEWVNSQGERTRNKYFPGCWIVALKHTDFYALRTCFFVWPTIERNDAISSIVDNLLQNRQFQAMCSSLNGAGFDVLQCFPVVDREPATIRGLTWRFHRYCEEELTELVAGEYFERWRGRGRVGRPRPWMESTVEKYSALEQASLTALALPQLFYSNFFKAVYRAGTMDPYDTDGFIISYDGKVFPIELKEKFPFQHSAIGRTLGVDAGRILMLLRTCLPMNSNGFYIVREVEETEERELVGWKIMRLDEVLMKCSWNLQAGGPGMASSAGGRGSRTSTILMPYREFSDMTAETFAETNLRGNATLTENTRRAAEEFMRKLNQHFFSQETGQATL